VCYSVSVFHDIQPPLELQTLLKCSSVSLTLYMLQVNGSSDELVMSLDKLIIFKAIEFIHIERANMHCQGIARTRPVNIGLTSADTKSLYDLNEQRIILLSVLPKSC
jgi:hypothetical protein